MSRYDDYASHFPATPDGNRTTVAQDHFEHWYKDFKQKLREERNPSQVVADDPRFAEGPWGIQRAQPNTLASAHRSSDAVLPSNATVRLPSQPRAATRRREEQPPPHPMYAESDFCPPLASVAVNALPPPLALEQIVPLGTFQLPYDQTLPNRFSAAREAPASRTASRPLPIYGITNMTEDGAGLAGSSTRHRQPSNLMPRQVAAFSKQSALPNGGPLMTPRIQKGRGSSQLPTDLSATHRDGLAKNRIQPQPTLTLKEILARKDALQQQELLIRRGILDAEAKYRAFIAANSKASVRGASKVREVAVNILTAHQEAMRGLVTEEASQRRAIAGGYAAWVGVIAAKELSERRAIASRWERMCRGIALLGGAHEFDLLTREEAAEREAIRKASDAAYQLLISRAERLRQQYQAVWGSVFGVLGVSTPSLDARSMAPLAVRQRCPPQETMRCDPSSSANVLVLSVLRHRLQQELTSLAEAETAERAALRCAEENYRATIASAFAARSSVRAERHRVLIMAAREVLSSSWQCLLSEEEAGRAAIQNAAEGWLKGIRVQCEAVVVRHTASLSQQRALVLKALAALPKLSDIEDDEAARRRYLCRTYDEWCAQTLAPVAAQLRSRHTALGVVTQGIRHAIYESVVALTSAEATARGVIVDSEAQWWPHLLLRERRERLEGVPQVVQRNADLRLSSPAFLYSEECYRQLRALAEEETCRREALLSAEAQWFRFARQSMHPLGLPPTTAAVHAMQRARSGDPVSPSNSKRVSVKPSAKPLVEQRAAVPPPSTRRSNVPAVADTARRPKVPWDEASDPIRSVGGQTALPSAHPPAFDFPLTHRPSPDNAINMQFCSTDVAYIPSTRKQQQHQVAQARVLPLPSSSGSILPL